MKKYQLTVCSILACSVLMFSMMVDDADARRGRGKQVKAVATIRSCNGVDHIRGRAVLRERRSDQGVKEVDVTMFLRGRDLPDGEHGVHIHEVASCEPCGSAGGHYDPGPNGNSSPDGNHPFHLGDLENIDAYRGHGELHATTTRVTLSDGPISVFDENGSAFIVHINPDTFCPNGEEAGCAGGGRLACGIIEPAKPRHHRGPYGQ